MKNRCIGRNQNLSRCLRNRNSLFFCIDHKNQWIVFTFFLIFTVGGGSASLYSLVKNDFILTEVKEISKNTSSILGSNLVHLAPDDFIFDLKKMSDDLTKIRNYKVNIKIHPKKLPVFLKRKATIERFELNESHFTYTDFEREFKLINIKLDKHSLNEKSNSALMTLILDTSFIFVRPIDVVYNADSLKEKRIGFISIRVYFDYQNKEHSKLVEIPIVFG